MNYLRTPITGVRLSRAPRRGWTKDGYTHRAGATSSFEILLLGERRWRRVYLRAFSNQCTHFVRIKGVPHIIPHVEVDPAFCS